MSSPQLSVVIPTRNEADNIVTLCDRLHQALAGISYELCIVDDSDDGTPTVLKQCQSEYPNQINCLFRAGEARDGGLSTAVVSGLQMARGQWVCVMDADLQHPPEQIPVMLRAAEGGADLVVASRYTAGASNRGLDGMGRRLVSRGATALARLLFSEARRSNDPLSGFFLCRRSVIEGIEFRPVGFKILLEILVCVPGIRVIDVPLDFRPRHGGTSKATPRQGLLYLRHLRSLVLDVDGSARALKFGIIGFSGLGLLILMLWLLVTYADVPPAIAFIPAFAASFLWNATFNRRWTFADLRRRHGKGSLRPFLIRALAAGLLMYTVFLLLLLTRLPILISALVAALLAMVANAVINRRDVVRSPAMWSGFAVDRGVQEHLARLAEATNARRAVIVPPDITLHTTTLPAELVRRAAATRRALLLTEAASHRPQRRSNVAVWSWLALPLVHDDDVFGVVLCERESEHSFNETDLETAQHGVDGLSAVIRKADLFRDDPGL